MIPFVAGSVSCPHGIDLDDDEIVTQRAILDRLTIAAVDVAWHTRWCRRCPGDEETQ